MNDIRVAAEQARVALKAAMQRITAEGWTIGWTVDRVGEALASLEAALAAQPSPVEAQAVPDLPVAQVCGDEDSPWYVQYFKPKELLPVGTQLFTRPTPAAADLHQQSHSVHLAGDETGRTSVEGGVNAPSAGWSGVARHGMPPCDGETVFIGINTAGFACCFNEVTHDGVCSMQGPEINTVQMSGLQWWRALERPAKEQQ